MPTFSASKIAWILNNVPGARERAERGELLFGTVDTWLIWNLTKGAVHVTDYTNASRTMLFDIHNLCWDQEILKRFNIPESLLAEGVLFQRVSTVRPMRPFWAARFLSPVRRETSRRRCSDSAALSREK